MECSYGVIATATYIPISPNEVIVKGGALEGFTLLIDDPERRGIAASIVELLADRPKTPVEVAAEIGDGISAEDCAELLQSMNRAGAIHVHTINSDLVDRQVLWTTFLRFGEVPDQSLLRPVTLVCSADSTSVLNVAESWGITSNLVRQEDLEGLSASDVREHFGESPLVYLDLTGKRAATMRFNEWAIQGGMPVLFARLDGVDWSIGPFVVPGSTPCMWEVERMWARSSADRPQYETLLNKRSQGEGAVPSEVGLSGFSTPLAVALLELALCGTCDRAGLVTHGKVTTLKLTQHPVMRLPRCPVCLPMQPVARNPLY